MTKRSFLKLCAVAPLALAAPPVCAAPEYMDFPLKDIEGRTGSLRAYEGKVLLLVNVASECGYTRQYEGLESLYQMYKDRGLVVMGFPCNDFGAQEPNQDREIQKFCKERYNVTFPMFAKVGIRLNAHPLFRALTSPASPIPGVVQWNFSKFLLGRDGVLKARFDSMDEPDGMLIKAAVEKALGS